MKLKRREQLPPNAVGAAHFVTKMIEFDKDSRVDSQPQDALRATRPSRRNGDIVQRVRERQFRVNYPLHAVCDVEVKDNLLGPHVLMNPTGHYVMLPPALRAQYERYVNSRRGRWCDLMVNLIALAREHGFDQPPDGFPSFRPDGCPSIGRE